MRIRRRDFLQTSGAAIAGAALPGFAYASDARDLVVYGATIHSVDPHNPNPEAFVVRGDRFVYTGSLQGALRAAKPNARRLNLHGSTVLPGLIDAHIHLQSVGLDMNEVKLHHVTSYDETIARTVAFAQTTHDEWILGEGWDQNLWPGKAFPTHERLSAAIPDRPVVLERVDGHALLVNAKAMQVAGVTATTADPSGGRIVRDANGAPTGVFVDGAMELIYKAIPEPSVEQLERATRAAIGEAHSYGLTAVAQAGANAEAFAAYRGLAEQGALDLRAAVMISDDPQLVQNMTANGTVAGAYAGRLWINAIKLFADGALGSRGAALLAPYSDDPGNVGLLRTTQQHIEEVCDLALKRGFQVNTHAIGDHANRMVLDAYEASLTRIPRNNHRFRVEHAQILSPQDIPRFAQLGVIPSMQTTHQISDMGWAESRLGPDRIKGAYAWRALLATGVPIPNGTDAPVEEVSTLRTFHAAISRQNEENQPPGGWYPDQRMTRAEALKSMTLWAAYASFQETVIGSIEPGKYADFVVMDRDWMRVAPEEIMGTQIQATYFAGRPVYQGSMQRRSMSYRGVRSKVHRPCACG